MQLFNKKLFVIPKPKSHPAIRLFCFPFAGGGINTYTSWLDRLYDNVELVLVQPPGRGSRLQEAPHASMDSLVYELMQYAEFITDVPYLLFGHSLGSRVAYELCYQLKANNMRLPECLIASGSKAPHILTDRRCIHDLPREAFVNELKQLNGTPQEVLDNDDLMDLLLPLLRSDFKIADSYKATAVRMPFPIVVFHGEEDFEIKPEHLMGWQDLSDFDSPIINFPGEHFFINDSKDAVISQVLLVLNELLSPMRGYSKA
ncbi:thioesterase II family protein [Alkalimonas amylolytica]|uniref:Surfactin synthase thioesterase subunit n=1 Tax=Alkalimonas amylolytica TaxID=152573 RepID=A0A1H4G2X4_ALKAM|nr:alpha/beta fold hydrolase [Alkalimonas amylolytica]SEB03935.1 Surfactin synthase thioesterase subunit [Alkalimonas amylolytica]